MAEILSCNIPDELKQAKQWVGWKYIQEPGKAKPTKPPYQIHDPSRRASSTDPSTWASFSDAMKAADNGQGLDGIGFVFIGMGPYVGIDLDHCIKDGKIEPWAQKTLDLFPGCYVEISPSGTGLHLIIKGKLPGQGRKKGPIETYCEGRYFTVTGQALPCSGADIPNHQTALDAFLAEYFHDESKGSEISTGTPGRSWLADNEVISKASSSNNGEKFNKLWEGDFSEYPSQSEADSALCVMLSFWCGKNLEQMDRIFRQSGLYRSKWDEKHGAKTYGLMTLERAEALTTEIYHSPGGMPENDEALAERRAIQAEATAQSPDPWENQIYTLKDAYAPREPLQFIVEGLLTLPSLSIMYGAPGTLKSLLLADMAVCVAAEIQWLSRDVIQAPVMWIDFDNGRRRTHERFAALAMTRNLPVETPFYYVSMPSPWLDATKREEINKLIERIINNNIKLVCIDNLGLISMSVKESDDGMIPVMANLRYLAECTGAAVVPIHHQRKGKEGNQGIRLGDSLRGHSSIEAAIDLALLVTREDPGDIITIQSTKTRDVEVEPFNAEFRYEHKQGTNELQEACFARFEVKDASMNKSVESEILRIKKDNPKFNQKQTVREVQKVSRAGKNFIREIYNKLDRDHKFIGL